MTQYSWDDNGFYQDIRRRVSLLWKNVNTKGMAYDAANQCWKQQSVPGKCSFVSFLQNESLCWDVTDRGIGVVPMIDDLRALFDLCAVLETAVGKTDLRSLPGQEIFFYPGSVERVYSLAQGKIRFRLTLPCNVSYAELTISFEGAFEGTVIRPYLLGRFDDFEQTTAGLTVSLKRLPIFDEAVSRNNSITADPPRPQRGACGKLLVSAGKPFSNVRVDSLNPGSQPFLICDRNPDPKEYKQLYFGEYHGASPIVLRIFQTSAMQAEKKARLDWDSLTARVNFSCGEDPRLERQFRYSIHNSLFSRTYTEQEETMFIHGRPDHGYGDCSKLHQSYQMYFPALLAGEYDSVKSELRAFSRLMTGDGSLSFQLKTGGGKHHYDGPYSNAHFLLGIHRYLCFSGDFDFLKETVLSGGKRRTILDCTLKAANWLLQGKTSGGVMKPCGWLDAWPPTVVAQAQISCTICHAFTKLSELLDLIGHPQAGLYQKEAASLKSSTLNTFLTKNNGIMAEHLFKDGSVRGGTPSDFWIHTQVWANISGMQVQSEPLELCERYGLSSGMRVIPDSGMLTDYIGASTDGLSDLGAGSTATWLLAAWPELTHLFALCRIRAGDPEDAYNAVCSQLPERLYQEFGTVSPFYYAEKYLYPYHIPWLCTWAGDPTFVEYIVEGLLGVQFSLDGFTVTPKIPKCFQNKALSLSFLWRGKQVAIQTDSHGILAGSKNKQ